MRKPERVIQRAMKNTLKELFEKVKDGDTVLLEKDGVYDVWQDDGFLLYGYYCSNTARKEENPNGFRRVAIYLKEKQNVTIDGNGALLRIHGIMTPVLFDHCKNITLKNLTMDYARPTMSEFTVLSNENGECVIQTFEDSLFDVQGDTLIWQGEKDESGKPLWENTYKNAKTLSMRYDPQTERAFFCRSGETTDARPSIPTFASIQRIDERHIKVVLKNKDAYFPVGHVYQTRNIVRDQLGGFFLRCENVLLEDMHIRFMHGFGLLAQYCNGVTYRNLQCVPPAERTIASNADFFHYSGCKGDILIENCQALGAHDDFINVHGTYLRVVEIYPETHQVRVRFMQPESWGFQAFDIGDEIEFVRTGNFANLGRATVTAYEKLDDTDILLTVNGDLPSNLQCGKDCVENITCNPTVTVRGNRFGPSIGRGMLCLTRKKTVVENNYFYKTGSCVLHIENDCCDWFESGRAGEIIFRGNVVDGCSYGSLGFVQPVIYIGPRVTDEKNAEWIFAGITIEHNRFIHPPYGKYDLQFGYVQNVTLQNNAFEDGFTVSKNLANNYTECNNE